MSAQRPVERRGSNSAQTQRTQLTNHLPLPEKIGPLSTLAK
jgi:hypothetical protein